MSKDLAELRDRVHRKSQEYFTFEYGRRDPKKWRMFYGATDALLDAGMAAAGYARAITSDPAVNLLVCYGFLQAIYIQQDAIRTLSRAVGLQWRPKEDARLGEIRDLRNRLTGHPARAGENEERSRPSSAIIAYHEVTQAAFRGHVYYEDGLEDVVIDVASILTDNEERLALQLQVIEQKMDEEEAQFRSEHSARPFSVYFVKPFDYLMQRLQCDLHDEARLPQAQAHAAMIREKMQALQEDLKNRGFFWAAISYHMGLIFTGLDLLEKIMRRNAPSVDDQHEFDLLYDGIEKNVQQLRSFIVQLDEKLNSAILRPQGS
jgi:hypothetical protein